MFASALPTPGISDVRAANSRTIVNELNLQRRKSDSKFVILVVDDEQITRMRISHFLKIYGYEVLEATNGREAIEMVRTHNVDVMLTDVKMPVLDGLKSTRLLRQMHDRSEFPIVVMTSAEGREQVLDAFEAGANDYISKPIDNDILLARLHNQLLVKNAQKALRESEERYALASQGTNDGIWDWNLKTGELYLSSRWREMVGIDESHTPVGNEWMELIHVEDRQRVVEVLESHLCGESEHFETELRMLDSNQDFCWMLCRGLAFKDEKGVACRIAGSLTDITVGKVADALTGLPNRVLFQDRIARAVEQLSRRPDQNFAVIYLDVDDFKLINDHLGHRVGDEFLVEVAQRIERAIRKSDSFVARLGGDEFAVMVESLTSAEDAIRVAKRIHEEMNVPFRVGDREILTRASMGIAIATNCTNNDDNPLNSELLLVQADAAMYLAKKQTDQAYCVFESHMLDENTMMLEMGNELRLAIQRDELHVHYQPIIDIDSSRTIGFEALLRWRNPVLGEIHPNKFIPIAESNGMIVEIGEWVLRESCKQILEWNRHSPTKMMISVNVSIRQIAKGSFLPIINRILEDTGVPPSLLRLEVTETVLMQNTEETIRLLCELRETGIKIGIDDFGTGYSSLSYLHKMPIDVLKIDRSFVSNMTESEKHLAIVRTIVTLAKSLNLQIVAEGIETVEQLELLQHLGCQMAQGFLFSKPQPEPEARKLLGKVWFSK